MQDQHPGGPGIFSNRRVYGLTLQDQHPGGPGIFPHRRVYGLNDGLDALLLFSGHLGDPRKNSND